MTHHVNPQRLLKALLFSILLLPALSYAKDTLEKGESLYRNQYLATENGAYRFYLQGDGNLVLRDWQTRKSLWSSGTHGKGGSRLILQGDGNLVLYTSSGKAVWSSKTVGSNAAYLDMQNDGNLVLYRSDKRPVWDTGTRQAGSGSGGSENNEAVSLLNAIRQSGATIILDWDNTIDIDSDYTVGSSAPKWMEAFAEANVDAWLVTGNG